MLRPGARVDAKYELVECLGEGGMGTVWCARHASLGHAVAIKFLQGSTQGTDARARFEREARIAARLGEASRHIARVIDHGVLDEIVPYLVMELLHGETLSARLKRSGQLSLASAARLTMQLCRALQVAHLAGVVHRDVKPANVFLCVTESDDEVLLKLMDFGVAKAARESEDDPTTRAGMAVGTPSYMSPEQILCKTVDARSDLWGVAACVYRMVTGRSPFGNGSIAELGLRILATDPPPPTSIVPQLPSSFDAWVAKALAKNPEERFQSARDLADSLALVAGVTRAASEPGLASNDTPPPTVLRIDGFESTSAIKLEPAESRPTRPDGVQRARVAPRPRRRIWVGVGLACASLGVGLLVPAMLQSGVRGRAPIVVAAPATVAPTAASSSPTTIAPSTRAENLVAAAAPSIASATEAAASASSAAPDSEPPGVVDRAAPRASTTPASSARPRSSAGQAALQLQADALWRKKDEL